MEIVTLIYRKTQSFPTEEAYGLTSQLRRCAVSLPSNIAEGYGRNSTQDYVRFLRVACGSLYEMQTQLEIALNRAYLEKEAFRELYDASQELERMLSSMIRKVVESQKV